MIRLVAVWADAAAGLVLHVVGGDSCGRAPRHRQRTTVVSHAHRGNGVRRRNPPRALQAVGVPLTLEAPISLNALTRKVYSVQLLRLLIALDVPVPASFHVSPNSAVPVF